MGQSSDANWMIKIRQLIYLFQNAQKIQATGNLGDFAILKADTLGAKANPAIANQLQSVVGYYPSIQLDELAQLPPGSFGYEYANHMRTNRLHPFNISPEMAPLAQRNVFALRYAVTHDIFHVLLGFDTSYAGEMGVLAFAVAQGYSSAQRLSLAIARVLYPLLAWEQRQQISVNEKRGWELGKQAAFLLGYRFEEHWAESLQSVRQQLGLPDPDESTAIE